MKTFFKNLFTRFKNWSGENVLMVIAIVGLAIFVSSYIIAIINKWETFPLGYLLKIPFAFISASLGTWGSILFVKYGLPDSFDKINTKTDGGIPNCTEWQQVVFTLFFIAEFAFIFAISVFAL